MTTEQAVILIDETTSQSAILAEISTNIVQMKTISLILLSFIFIYIALKITYVRGE